MRRKASDIVTDARRKKFVPFPLYRHVGAFGKDCVEMRGDDYQLAAGFTGSAQQAKDIARFIHFDVGKACLPKHGGIGLGAFHLLEGRCRDLRQRNDRLDPLRMLFFKRIERDLHCWPRHDSRDQLVVRRSRTCRLPI